MTSTMSTYIKTWQFLDGVCSQLLQVFMGFSKARFHFTAFNNHTALFLYFATIYAYVMKQNPIFIFCKSALRVLKLLL